MDYLRPRRLVANGALLYFCALRSHRYADEDRVVSASSDHTVKVWDPRKRSSVRSLESHTDYVQALARTNNYGVASGGLDNHVLVWDLEVGTCVVQCGGLEGIGGSVYTLDGCGDYGGDLLVAGVGRSVVMYDSRTGAACGPALRGHSDLVRAVSVRGDGLTILSGGADNCAILFDVRQRRSLRVYDDLHEDSVWSLAASKDSSFFLSGGRDGRVCYTSMDDGRNTLLVSQAEKSPRENMILKVILSPTEEDAFWVSTTGSTVRKWAIDDGYPLRMLGEDLDAGREPDFANLRLSDRARQDWAGHCYPLCSGPNLSLPGMPGTIQFIVLNSRRHILTLDTSGTVRLIEVLHGRLERTFPPGMTIETLAAELNEEVSIPQWFTCILRGGVLHIKLEMPTVFSAELYATDVDLEDEQYQDPEQKINLGEYMLNGLLFQWKKLRPFDAQGPAHFRELHEQKDNRRAEKTRQTLPRPKAYPGWSQLAVFQNGSSACCLRKQCRELDGSEADQLPKWALKCVTEGLSHTPDTLVKISFVLEPSPESGLPALNTSRLSAPRFLRVAKVQTFVLSQLPRAELDKRPGVLETDVRIVCNGRLLDRNMSLATVQQFVWRLPRNVELQFSIVW